MFINKNYSKLLAATFITRLGDSLDSIAFAWLVYVMTGSRVLMGGIFVVSVLPNLIILPFAGVIADSYNKKVITAIGDVSRGIFVALLALLYVLNALQVWHLFAFVAINNIFESFADPSRGSILKSLITDEDMVKGNSYLTSARTIGSIIGISLAGVIIGFIGVWACIIIDAITFFISAILIVSMKYKDHTDEEDHVKPDLRGSLKMIVSGFRYLKGKSFLVTLVIFSALINFFFVPFNILQPVYVDEVMQLGAEGMTYLGLAILIGMASGGLYVGKYGKKYKIISMISVGLGLMGFSYFLLGAINYLNLDLIPANISIIFITFCFGFFLPIINAPVHAYMMRSTAPEMIGRLMSIIGVFALCAMPLGGTFVSLIGDSIPVTLLFVSMGILIILLSLIFWTTNRKRIIV